MARNTLENTLKALFDQDPEEVAMELLGRQLVRTLDNGNQIKGRLKEISAWAPQNKLTKYVQQEPGILTVSLKFGRYLTDITTTKGSCITLVSFEYTKNGKTEQVEGPGNVSETLCIEPQLFDEYDITNPTSLKLEGQGVERNSILRRNRNVPENCLGYFYIR